MNQAISNALLFNLMITFVVILIAFFVGSMSYSKASKVNNRILEEIEKQAEGSDKGRHQENYITSSQLTIINDAYKNASCDILTWLDKGDYQDSDSTKGIGYRKAKNSVRNCPSVESLDFPDSSKVTEVTSDSTGTCDYNINPYEYCVYRVNECKEGESCYTYYHVITYMYFDVPVISELIRLPIHGETMGFRVQNS